MLIVLLALVVVLDLVLLALQTLLCSFQWALWHAYDHNSNNNDSDNDNDNDNDQTSSSWCWWWREWAIVKIESITYLIAIWNCPTPYTLLNPIIITWRVSTLNRCHCETILISHYLHYHHKNKKKTRRPLEPLIAVDSRWEPLIAVESRWKTKRSIFLVTFVTICIGDIADGELAWIWFLSATTPWRVIAFNKLVDGLDYKHVSTTIYNQCFWCVESGDEFRVAISNTICSWNSVGLEWKWCSVHTST